MSRFQEKSLTPKSTFWKYEQDYMHIKQEGKNSRILMTIPQTLLKDNLYVANTTK